MNLIRYLEQHFHSEEQLLEAASLDAATLHRLQQTGAMPRPSYRLRLATSCDSFFGAHSEETSVNYYAKGNVAWIATLRLLGDHVDLPEAAFELFASRYRDRLAQLAAEGLTTDLHKFHTGLDAHIGEEWQHFLSGTYGLCTRSGLPEDIAAKELAVVMIKGATEERASDLSAAERQELRRAVDLLDVSSSMYAPHEVARSSRHRLIDDVRKNYALEAKSHG